MLYYSDPVCCDVVFPNVVEREHLVKVTQKNLENSLEVTYELPGVKKANVTVSVEDSDRSSEVKYVKVNVVLRDNSKYSDRVQFSTCQFNPETVQAKLEDGILTVIFEHVKKVVREIEIK